MKTQCYDVVVASRVSHVADKTVDETYRQCFPKGASPKQVHEAHRSKITIFRVEAKQIDKAAVKKFENFLVSNGFTKLFSLIYVDTMSELDARFFRIKMYSKNLEDMKELLIAKIEKAIGRKLNLYNSEIYYFHLTKAQLKSRKLVRLVDDLYNFPCIDNLICV